MAQQRPTLSLYEADFYTWTHEQARLLRDGRFEDVDLSNLIEEIETLGRSEASSLQSSLRVLILHLLKLIHQPEKATKSWRNTVNRERLTIEQILDETPGLKPRLTELFGKAYNRARREAAFETGLPLETFPLMPDFTLERIRDETFLPSPGSAAIGSIGPADDDDA